MVRIMEEHEFIQRHPQNDGVCAACGLTIGNDCHFVSTRYLDVFEDLPDIPDGMPALDTNQDVPEQVVTGTIKLSDLPMVAGLINRVEEQKTNSIGIPWEVMNALKQCQFDVDEYQYHVDFHEEFMPNDKTIFTLTIMETPKDGIS